METSPFYGGGFMPNSQSFGSPSSPSGAGRRGNTSNSLRPVTIPMLLRATQAHTDAEWIIDNNEVGAVTLVAQIMSITPQATNTTYWLDDGYGRIECRHWADSNSEEDAEKWGGLHESQHIRLTGSLKMFNSKRYINASHIRPVKDFHEVYYHMLEVITATLTVERGPPNRGGQLQGSTTAPTGSTSASAYNTQSHATNTNQFSHLTPIQQKIIAFVLANNSSPDGVHVAAIARAMGGTAPEISDALDKLMDEGYVFTARDESHFKVAQ